MPQQNNLLGEAAAAARGVVAVVIGDREAARFFNLTTHGLAGSFIALLVITGIGAYLPVLLGYEGRVLLTVAVFALSFVLQVGCATIALLQAKRLDGFVPYLVVDNWASFYVTIAGLAFNLMGVGDDFIGVPIGFLIVIVAVNIGRVIIKLEPLQTGMFVVAQVVGYLVGGIAISALFAALGFSS